MVVLRRARFAPPMVTPSSNSQNFSNFLQKFRNLQNLQNFNKNVQQNFNKISTKFTKGWSLCCKTKDKSRETNSSFVQHTCASRNKSFREACPGAKSFREEDPLRETFVRPEFEREPCCDGLFTICYKMHSFCNDVDTCQIE